MFGFQWNDSFQRRNSGRRIRKRAKRKRRNPKSSFTLRQGVVEV
jgi:hypothetical protein